MRPEDFGFWGAVTSSIDWCEANYEHLRYVCEFFNTVSSFAMLGVGLWGLLIHRRVLELRFLLAFFALAVVGLGSAAFHATLRYEFQMLDELPMLYLALVMVFILVENQRARRLGRWFPWALALHGVVVTLLSAGTRGNLQFLAFHLSFGSLELFCLIRVTLLYRCSRDTRARRLYRLGMSAYLLAIVLWFIDLRFCSFVSVALPFNPQLHAFWHLLVSLGFYCLIVFIARERLTALGIEPKLAG